MSEARNTGTDDISGIVRESLELDRKIEGFEDVIKIFKQVPNHPMEMSVREKGNGHNPEKRAERKYFSSLDGIPDYLKLTNYKHPSSISAELRPNYTRPEEPENEKYQLKISVTAEMDPSSKRLKNYDSIPKNSNEKVSIAEEANLENSDRVINYWIRNLEGEPAGRVRGSAPQIEHIGRNSMTVEEITSLLNGSKDENKLLIEKREREYARGDLEPSKVARYLDENFNSDQTPEGEFRIYEEDSDNRGTIGINLQFGGQYNPEFVLEGKIVGDQNAVIHAWEEELETLDGRRPHNVYGIRI